MRLTPHQLMMALRGMGVGAAAAAAVALTGPFRYADLGLPFPDTVAHAALFYGLCILTLSGLPRSRTFDLTLALVAIGAASEVAQGAVGREMSFHDFAGDTVGVAAAALPALLGQFRALVRRHPHASFAELRRMDRRRARPRVAARLRRDAAQP